MINEIKKYLTGKPIVIIGNDGTGKTTILNKLKKDIPLYIGKSSLVTYCIADAIFVYKNDIATHNVIRNKDYTLALDRHGIIDTYVYDGIFKQSENIKIEDVLTLLMGDDQTLNLNKNFDVIYTYATNEDIKQRLRARGDQHLNTLLQKGVIESINNRYETLIPKLNNIIKVNTSTGEVTYDKET